MSLPDMPTSFLGLFLFSTALSLACTFVVVAVLAVVRKVRGTICHEPPRLR
jgi:hypothetical protein